MARFNLNGFLDNGRFEDFFARFGGGSSDHDHLNGTTASNRLSGGAKEDTLAGMAGNCIDRRTLQMDWSRKLAGREITLNCGQTTEGAA